MTESLCEEVAERVALGEALAELSEHVSSCESCQGLVAVSNKLGAAHHAVDPGLGFSARMTVGAQHLLGVRRRRRFAAGLAATVATGMFGVFVVARSPESTAPAPTDPTTARPMPPTDQDRNQDRNKDAAEEPADADLAALVDLADTERSSHLSAHWGHIKKPLSPYKKLLKGVVP
jgi:hypothetical protein